MYFCFMNLFKSILAYILAATILTTASGIVVFHTFCICSGVDHYSLYVTPATCNESYHIKYAYEEKSSLHTDKCGCNNPDVKFYKLDDKALNDNLKSEKIQPLLLSILQHILPVDIFLSSRPEPAITDSYYTFPHIYRSLEFLILIQQLKILNFFKI